MHRYARAAWQECQRRHRLYPDRILQGKMTAATAAQKIRLLRDVANIFVLAEIRRCDPLEMRLPIREPGPGPLEVDLVDLTAHIAELRDEIRWSVRLLRPNADRTAQEHRLELLREILTILESIQTTRFEAPPLQAQHKVTHL